jgi:transposase/predicted Fe-Mo cluster-binding NifX family protein
MQEFNETTVLVLMESGRKHGRFAHNAIVQKGTGVMIDGFHRTEAVKRLKAKGVDVYLGVEEYETDDPAALAIEINKTRRTWTTEEERRTQVQFLTTQTDAGGDRFSIRQIAEAVGASHTTIKRDKAKVASVTNVPVATQPPSVTNVPVGAQPATPSKGKDGRSYSPPATEAEKAKAWEMKDSGMSTPAIAKDLGYPRRTVDGWFRKERPEAVAIGQPVMPAPKPKPEEPLTPTGQISKETKDIVSKEKKCLQQKIEQVEQLDELNEQFTVYWRHLQKNWTKQGRSVVKMHREVAEKIFLRDGTMQPLAEALGLPKTASLEDCLWGMQARAKKLESSIRSALCFYYYIESMTVEQRPE